MTNPTTQRWRRRLAPVAAALAVAACATATPYQPLRSSGGFSEQRIESNRYRVSFTGNEYTSRQQVENYLLFRAAELTLANGYDTFTIVRRDTDKDVDIRTTPGWGSYSPYWRPYWRYYGRPYGWRYWDPWYGDPFWADRMDVRTVTSYEATAEIVMTRGPGTGPQSFNARQVIANLRPTIQIPR
ncbi:MAG TPA: hypothetical protein VNJ05_03655 [Sphingomicrobium sp.]|nr:hypothetical protein [Sphingomicrobium sp.]